MTPDLDEIRAALAAATPNSPLRHHELVANAPTWLAALCDEVEQLRKTWIDHAAHVYVAERDAALAENERLRAVVESQAEHIGMGDQIAEEDKAEIERLRAEIAWLHEVVGNQAAQLEVRP